MKKVLSICLTLVLLLAAALPALAEEPAVFELSGLVIDSNEEGVLLDTTEYGEILVLLNDDTLLDTPDQEAIMALEDISDEDKAAIDAYLLTEQVNGVRVGDYVHVIYDGKMTRSLPAQVTAKEIRCYMMIGQVITWDDLQAAQTSDSAETDGVDAEAAEPGAADQPEADVPAEDEAVDDEAADDEAAEDGAAEDEAQSFLFQDVLTGAQVLVTLPQDTEETFEAGQQLVIYYNGIMTMSLPGQINPDLITVFVPETETTDADNGNG